jgi:hypothetical protein
MLYSTRSKDHNFPFTSIRMRISRDISILMSVLRACLLHPELFCSLLVSSFILAAVASFTSPIRRCYIMSFMLSSSPPMEASRSRSIAILETQLNDDLSARLLTEVDMSNM